MEHILKKEDGFYVIDERDMLVGPFATEEEARAWEIKNNIKIDKENRDSLK